MDLPEWYEGKSPAYVECVDKFVEQFREDAVLEEDVQPDTTDPDDNPEQREAKRQAVAEFIYKAFPDDARNFQDDAFAALVIQRKLDAEDDENQYGHLDEYGEPRVQSANYD